MREKVLVKSSVTSEETCNNINACPVKTDQRASSSSSRPLNQEPGLPQPDPHRPILLDGYSVLQNLHEGEEDLEGERQVLQKIDCFASLTHQAFIKRFRVSKELAHDIIQEVTPFMQAPFRRTGISIQQKVFVALRFLGYGSYQEITGGNTLCCCKSINSKSGTV
ncbi:hypothetical protein NQ315_003588 [Exocentrus adspersus]|uniref:Uncharacterized protein n=1 Tax=Exocentrus adspersus TaxID=1586481 RepID=A0AAV8VJP3_9CUCU|nr:hypothetical protein NQ315_003588 [Exocentrus adspersus]